jgi:hypothetical protein
MTGESFFVQHSTMDFGASNTAHRTECRLRIESDAWMSFNTVHKKATNVHRRIRKYVWERDAWASTVMTTAWRSQVIHEFEDSCIWQRFRTAKDQATNLRQNDAYKLQQWRLRYESDAWIVSTKPTHVSTLSLREAKANERIRVTPELRKCCLGIESDDLI